ncbi:MAG: undecaprenyl-diphosphate phosphatase [Thermoleophilia bacterium]|nr:undecaprenyl-diphosphate phosphatase [Thermoleophilia bacterium]
MSWLEAIVLGVVQGLTEFLPISSSGHLRIVPALFGWEDPGAGFTAVIQIGTVAAVLIYFRRELWRITTTWLRSLRDPALRPTLDARMGWYVIVGTIPISILGLAFADQIETTARNLYLIGAMLIGFGLVMQVIDTTSRKVRSAEDAQMKDAIAVGFAQALALIPGVSRSGATISAGLLLGMNREAAARFSFLLSVPAIVLSGGYQFAKIVTGAEQTDAGLGALAVATVVSFVVGYAAIAFLLRYLARHSLGIFVWYRVVLGVLVIALAAAGTIS